jgi:hypothetical protein
VRLVDESRLALLCFAIITEAKAMQETTTYQPDEEIADAFEAAIDALPDSLSSCDLGAFVWGLMRIYDIDPMKRVSICTTIIDMVTLSCVVVDDDKSIH